MINIHQAFIFFQFSILSRLFKQQLIFNCINCCFWYFQFFQFYFYYNYFILCILIQDINPLIIQQSQILALYLILPSLLFLFLIYVSRLFFFLLFLLVLFLLLHQKCQIFPEICFLLFYTLDFCLTVLIHQFFLFLILSALILLFILFVLFLVFYSHFLYKW